MSMEAPGRPRYGLARDLFATARMYLDAYLLRSRAWRKLARRL